eukprot:6202188-Pleurochrysis_carterae.AAC.1
MVDYLGFGTLYFLETCPSLYRPHLPAAVNSSPRKLNAYHGVCALRPRKLEWYEGKADAHVDTQLVPNAVFHYDISPVSSDMETP